MLKTFLLTATLAASAFVVGYQGNEIVHAAQKVRAEMKAYWAYDPEQAYFDCVDKMRADAFAGKPYDVNDCRAHAEAWAARDGKEVAAATIIDRALAN
jgi:hypothetical protein